MNQFLHKNCGETAVEGPGSVLPRFPNEFPFTCLSCLGEVEHHSDLIPPPVPGFFLAL